MPPSKAPKASSGALLKTWRQEGPSGARAKFRLRIRRAAALSIALGLVVWLAYLVFSPMFLPKTYLAYWCLDEVQPLVAPPIEFAYEDFAGLTKLQSSLTPLQPGRPLLYGRMAAPELVDKQILGLKESGISDGDTLILFVSAHGVTRGDKAYLMCSNFTDAIGSQSRETGLVEVADFVRRLESLPGATKLILLDATRCDYAPRLGMTVNVFAEVLKSAIEKLDLATVHVLCASSAGEVSHVSRGLKRSVFGYMTANGLQGAADFNTDGEVQLRELYDFVRFNVSEWVKQATDNIESQTPLLLGAELGGPTDSHSHLLFTGGLPEIGRDNESAESVSAYVTDFMTDEVSEFGFDPVVNRLASGVDRAKEILPGTEDEQSEEGVDGEEEAEASPGLDREQSELGLLAEAWQLTDRVEQGPNPPLNYAPHLWRLHKDRLLWLELRQQAGVRLDERSLVDELRGVIQSLQDLNDPKKKAPQQPRNVVDRLRLLQPTAPMEIDVCPSLALAELVVATDLKKSVPQQLSEFVSSYDGWISGSEGLDELNSLLEKTTETSWRQFYEFQLLDTLRSDAELSPETIKSALEVRRLGEKVASDLQWGQGWAANLVDQADRLRLEGERLLVDKAASDWSTRSTQNLQRARRLYLDARQQLSFVHQATRLQRELLSNARDYLRWCRYSSGDTSSRAPSAQSLESLLGLLVDLRTELNSTDRTRIPNTQLLDRIRQDLERRTLETAKDLTDSSHKAGDSRRIDSLLRTTLLNAEARSDCISARLTVEKELARNFKLSKPATLSQQTLSAEKLRKAAEQLHLEQKFIQSFQPVPDRHADPSINANAVSFVDLRRSGDALRDRLSKVPAELAASVSSYGDLSERGERPERLELLRRADQGLYLIDAMDLGRPLENSSDSNLLQSIRNAQWFDLLMALRERYWRASADAPQEEADILDRMGRRLGGLASRIPDQPKVEGRPLARLDLQVGQPDVQLEANDESELSFTVKSASDMPVWIMAQYDQSVIDVASRGWTILKEHVVLAAPPNDQTSDTSYPHRPSVRRGTPPPLLLSAGQSRQLKLSVRRRGTPQGDTTLVLKAVGEPDYVRQSIPIRLPGQQQLQFSIAGARLIGTGTTGSIGLFPNRVQELTIQVANTGDNHKSVTANLYAPQQAPSEAIPPGSLESSAAEQILRTIGPRKDVAIGAPLELSPGGQPVPLIFNFDSPENKSLLGADAKAGPIRIPLSQGLLLDLVDDQKRHTIHWMPFEIWRPRAYLKARARYDVGVQELTVFVEAPDPERLPKGSIRVDLDIDKRFLSARGGGRYSATLRAPDYRAELQALLNGSLPQDYDPQAEDYLPVRVRVDSYPRGFEFHIRETTAPVDIDPEKDLTAIRVVPPEKSVLAATPVIRAKFEIDAPEGYFDVPENYVEFGVDDDQDRDLRGDASFTRKNDRQVELYALKPTAGGTLAFEPRVGDFEVDLPTEGIVGRSVNILAQFRSGAEYLDSDYEEVVLDGEGPILGPPRFTTDGESLVVEVNPQDLTGVQSVEAAFESSAEVKWIKGKLQAGGQWIITLKADELPPGEHTVLLKATDVVGNVRDDIRETWTKIAAVAEASPEGESANNAAAKPVKNRVSGQVTYGTREVTAIEVKLIGAGAPVQPARIGPGGSFDFGLVPPGTYTLSARGLSGGNFHSKEMEITVSDQPETPWREEVKIR